GVQTCALPIFCRQAGVHQLGLAQVGERRLVGKAFAGFLQDCQNIGVLIWIDLGGNTLRILVSPKTLLHEAPWMRPIAVLLLFYLVMNSTDLDPFVNIKLIPVEKWLKPISFSETRPEFLGGPLQTLTQAGKRTLKKQTGGQRNTLPAGLSGMLPRRREAPGAGSCLPESSAGNPAVHSVSAPCSR